MRAVKHERPRVGEAHGGKQRRCRMIGSLCSGSSAEIADQEERIGQRGRGVALDVVAADLVQEVRPVEQDAGLNGAGQLRGRADLDDVVAGDPRAPHGEVGNPGDERDPGGAVTPIRRSVLPATVAVCARVTLIPMMFLTLGSTTTPMSRR